MPDRRAAAGLALIALAGCQRAAAPSPTPVPPPAPATAPAVVDPPPPAPLPVEHLVLTEVADGAATPPAAALSVVLEPKDLSARVDRGGGIVSSFSATAFWDDELYRLHDFHYRRDRAVDGGLIVRRELVGEFVIRANERKEVGVITDGPLRLHIWAERTVDATPAPAVR